MHSDLNRELEELNMDANSAILHAATMEPPVSLRESDIVDPSRRGMFKYAMRDVESLESLLNDSEAQLDDDDSALTEEVDGILNHWRLLFPIAGLTGGLQWFAQVLEQVLPELRGNVSQEVKTVQELLKNLKKFDAPAREERNVLTARLQERDRRIKELQALLMEEEKHRAEESELLAEVNRNLRYTSSVREGITGLCC